MTTDGVRFWKTTLKFPLLTKRKTKNKNKNGANTNRAPPTDARINKHFTLQVGKKEERLEKISTEIAEANIWTKRKKGTEFEFFFKNSFNQTPTGKKLKN